jgi:parallel beta-helix repeat protein
MRTQWVPFALSIAVAALALAAGPASAADLQCGSVVKKSVKLKSDITGCTGAGLIIGARGVEIDLNGHLVEGANPRPPFPGIDNTGGFDRVRVVDGRINRFQSGIRFAGSHHSTVADVTITEVQGGIELSGSRDNRIVRNDVSALHPALSILGSNRNVVRHNVLLGDPDLSLTNSHANQISANTLARGSHGVWVRGSNRNLLADNSEGGGHFAGFELFSGRGNELRRNTASNASDAGILVYAEARQTLLQGNTADGNGGDGIEVRSPSTTLRRNSASNNFLLGINAVDGVTDGGGNRASGNGDPRQCVGVSCAPAN